MLSSIGRARGEEGLLDLLAGCHARIRHFAELARTLAGSHAPADEIAAAAAAVHRYFSIALPLHTRDEDDSLAPRLAGRSPAVDAAVARLTAEHAAHAAPLARLCELTAAIAAAPGRVAALAATLAPLAEALRAELEAHLALEEAVIFPAVAALPAADQAAIVAELRARRG